ncbi:hypothetical protein LTR95_009348 [Oleoguttula sp. CCFEE 5521]
MSLRILPARYQGLNTRFPPTPPPGRHLPALPSQRSHHPATIDHVSEWSSHFDIVAKSIESRNAALDRFHDGYSIETKLLKTITELVNRCSQLDADINTLRDFVRKMDLDRDTKFALRQDLQNSRMECAGLKIDIVTLHTKITTSDIECGKMQQMLEQQQVEHSTLAAEYTKLHDENAAIRDENEQLENRLETKAMAEMSPISLITPLEVRPANQREANLRRNKTSRESQLPPLPRATDEPRMRRTSSVYSSTKDLRDVVHCARENVCMTQA